MGDPLLEKLKENFNLDEKHVLILEILHTNDGFNAKQICEKTQIPLGRIYDYLNYLLKNKLIQRSHKKPFLYSIADLNENVIGFMKKRVDNLVGAQSEIMDMMKKSELGYFERITSTKKFTHVHLSMISETKKAFNSISLHTSFPYMLYPYKRDMFLKLRKSIAGSRPTITFFDPQVALLVYKTYLEAFEKGKEFNLIFEKKSFDFHVKIIKKLGKSYFNEWKKTVIEQFKKYNIRGFVIDEYLPLQMDVNEKRVNIILRHHSIINGIVIYGRDITELYNQIFMQHKLRAKDVLPLIKNL